MKIKAENLPNKKDKYFHKNIVVIEKEWCSDVNETDGATFLLALIKLSKNRINKETKFPHNTKELIQIVAVNNSCNTHIFQILGE